MLTDSVTLHLRAGRGGRGAATFRSQPFEPRGGPDGGDGGRGGSVILRATGDEQDLHPLLKRARWAAEDGLAGAGGRKGGRNGADLVLEVPVGTTAFDAESGDVLADLINPGDSAVLAVGGAGGAGNIHRASSIKQAPTTSGQGEPGEFRDVRLELRLPADLVLLGPANAGKSTLLTALTNARPKIAGYAHSTLQPEPGMLFDDRGEPLKILEIPPGDRWLRHLERARVVALVTPAAAPGDLRSFRRLAGDRPTITVYTKTDEGVAPRLRGGLKVSAETGVGVAELRRAIIEAVRAAPVRPVARLAPRRVALKPVRRGPAVTVSREAWGFEVTGPGLAALLEKYDLEKPEAFDRFQVTLDRMGVNTALEEAGAEEGDTVRLAETEFEYHP